MITKDDCGRPFDYDTVSNRFDELAAVEIGKHFVSKEAMAEIENILDLDNRDEVGLRALRNAVVVLFCQKKRFEANIGPDGNVLPNEKVDYDRLMYWSTKISGITAVIDNVLWKKGYSV